VAQSEIPPGATQPVHVASRPSFIERAGRSAVVYEIRLYSGDALIPSTNHSHIGFIEPAHVAGTARTIVGSSETWQVHEISRTSVAALPTPLVRSWITDRSSNASRDVELASRYNAPSARHLREARRTDVARVRHRFTAVYDTTRFVEHRGAPCELSERARMHTLQCLLLMGRKVFEAVDHGVWGRMHRSRSSRSVYQVAHQCLKG
jgi:hypothetical protein